MVNEFICCTKYSVTMKYLSSQITVLSRNDITTSHSESCQSSERYGQRYIVTKKSREEISNKLVEELKNQTD